MRGKDRIRPDLPWGQRMRPDQIEDPPDISAFVRPAHFVKQLTGPGLDSANRWQVTGTDLGIPYLLENGSVGFLFGDTFSTPTPDNGTDWRSPVMLRSNIHPGTPGGVVFDSAARVAGNGLAPQLMDYTHGNGGGCDPKVEITRIPNDAVSSPENGRQVLSYMSVYCWPDKQPWRTRYAALAYSDNGNDFVKAPGAEWPNDGDNKSPFQMWTMQRDGAYVYVFSVRSGRQHGPMMLQRVPWQHVLEPAAYEPWGWTSGSGWQWGQPCTPILEASFGEPSVRKLRDGYWAMSYSLPGQIVTRWADGPDRVWSDEKVQVTDQQEPFLYGGFIHPYSTSAVDDLHLLVSTWRRDASGKSTAYHVSQYAGTL